MNKRIVVAAALAIGLMAMLATSGAAQGPGGRGMKGGGGHSGMQGGMMGGGMMMGGGCGGMMGGKQMGAGCGGMMGQQGMMAPGTPTQLQQMQQYFNQQMQGGGAGQRGFQQNGANNQFQGRGNGRGS
ncbi:MAG TPA: hypothetical protein VLM40_07145 [Gemmata sp.]|nr:hypothetical protein [Gemmata sp.]